MTVIAHLDAPCASNTMHWQHCMSHCTLPTAVSETQIWLIIASSCAFDMLLVLGKHALQGDCVSAAFAGCTLAATWSFILKCCFGMLLIERRQKIHNRGVMMCCCSLGG